MTPRVHRGANPIRRRAVLLGAAAVLARPAGAVTVPDNGVLAFRMIRHGDAIGTHRLTFTRDGDTLRVHILVEALVTLLSIPIVRYRHEAVETWRDGRLVGIVANTNKNGDHEWAKANMTEAGLEVTGSKTRPYVAPEHALPTSYWNKRILSGKMISLEDGVLLAPKVAAMRTDTIMLASGRQIAADHYNLSGPFNVDLWYDHTQTWAGMAVTVADGSEVRYERL